MYHMFVKKFQIFILCFDDFKSMELCEYYDNSIISTKGLKPKAHGMIIYFLHLLFILRPSKINLQIIYTCKKALGMQFLYFSCN